MNQAKRASSFGVGHSEKMICVECFRAKGDEDLKVPCQNPRCHFYLCTPSSFKAPRQEVYPNEPLSPSFSKEVGHDRRSRPTSHTLSADDYSGQLCSKEWQSHPLSPGLSQTSLQKMRSKSTSTSASYGGSASMLKLLNNSFAATKEGDRQKFLRSHFASLQSPDYTEPYLGRESQLQGDLVEDAFVSSPLLVDYGERVTDKVSLQAVIIHYELYMWGCIRVCPCHFVFCVSHSLALEPHQKPVWIASTSGVLGSQLV